MQIKLTPIENELLIHRLEADDAIAECINTDNPEYTYEQVIDEIKALGKGPIYEVTNELRKLILWDAVDGATILRAAADVAGDGQSGSPSIQKYNAMYAAADRIEDKFLAAGIDPVHFPR